MGAGLFASLAACEHWRGMPVSRLHGQFFLWVNFPISIDYKEGAWVDRGNCRITGLVSWIWLTRSFCLCITPCLFEGSNLCWDFFFFLSRLQEFLPQQLLQLDDSSGTKLWLVACHGARTSHSATVSRLERCAFCDSDVSSLFNISTGVQVSKRQSNCRTCVLNLAHLY